MHEVNKGKHTLHFSKKCFPKKLSVCSVEFFMNSMEDNPDFAKLTKSFEFQEELNHIFI